MAKVTVNLRGADKINQMLRDLPKHLTQGKTGGIAAKSLRKGGRVLVKEEKKTLRAAIEAGTNYSTGTLEKKLTVKRVKYDGKGVSTHATLRVATVYVCLSALAPYESAIGLLNSD